MTGTPPEAASLRALAARWLSHDAPPFVQFVKYAAVGVMATVIQTAFFYLMAATCCKCLGASDPAVRFLGFPSVEISDTARAVRSVLATGVGFTLANIFCWLMNRLFVFKPGRHVWFVEFALFFGVSLAAVGFGLVLQWGLIRFAGWTTSAAFFVEILSSLAINYVVRKFFVFKG